MTIKYVGRVIPDRKEVLHITISEHIHGYEITQPKGDNQVNEIFIPDLDTLRELHTIIGQFISDEHSMGETKNE